MQRHFALGILLSAMTVGVSPAYSTGGAAAPILPDSAEWGAPPVDDWPQLTLKPLPYSGWLYYFKPGSVGRAIATAPDRIVLDTGENLAAFRLEDGAADWAGTQASVWDSVNDKGTLYGNDNGALAAFDIATGAKLWQSSLSRTPLAVAPQGVWVVGDETQNDNDYDTWYSNVMVLDRATGKPVQLFAVGALLSVDPLDRGSYQQLAQLPALPVKSKDGLLLLKADGTMSGLKTARHGWKARMAVGQNGFCALETAPYPRIPEGMDDAAGEAYANRSLIDPATGKPGPAAYLSYFALPEGQLRWRHPVASDWQITATSPRIDGDYVLVTLDASYSQEQPGQPNLIFRLADGELIYSDAGTDPTTDIALHSGRLYRLLQESDGGSYLQVLDLASGEWHTARLNIEDVTVAGLDFAADRLLLELRRGGWNDSYAANEMLAVVELDEAGLPREGVSVAINPPDEHQGLVQAFFATSDPRQDSALMGRVVAGGFNSLLRLLQAAGPEDTPQLDALAAAAVYMQARAPEGRRYSLNFLDSFAGELRERDLQPYAVTLARWKTDASLAPLHGLVTGLLALAGDPVDNLGDHWETLGGHEFAPPAPLNLRASYPTGFGPGLVPVKPSELVSGDGTRFAAFFANGLETAATVYIAVDHDKDGNYEEVLPTRLLHFFRQDIQRGETTRLDSSKFSLDNVEGDQLTISHQEAFIPDGSADTGWPEARPVIATVRLTDLRTDSDGDRLTDVAEELLFTDPANPDTDGDGLSDLEDLAPNVDFTQMGRDERAIARALKYFFEWPEGYRADWWADASGQASGNPWQARYLYVNGAGPVAFTLDRHTYCVCKVVADEYSRWNETPPSFVAGDTSVSVSISPASNLKLSKQAEVTVSINFHGVGYAVDLKEVAGEYYPVLAYMTWIS